MTVAPDVPALQVGEPAEAIDALRGAGLRGEQAAELDRADDDRDRDREAGAR